MKKIFKTIFIFLLAILILCSAFAIVSGRTYLFKAVYYNFAGIDDYKIFDNNKVLLLICTYVYFDPSVDVNYTLFEPKR